MAGRQAGLLLPLLVSSLLCAEDLFDTAKRLARTEPAEALALLPQLKRPSDREQIRRLAVLTAASIDRATAARELSEALNSPWAGEVLFHDAIALAPMLDDSTAGIIVTLSAARHPLAAVQNWPLIERLPYADRVLEAAALRAPDEAVGILASDSQYSQSLRQAFARSDNSRMGQLLALASDRTLDAGLRVRAAFLPGAARSAGDLAVYFHQLAEARLRATGDAEKDALDRGLARFATELCQAYQQSPARAPEVGRLSARDLYLLLAYSRAGDEDTYFADIFDRSLAPLGKLGAVIAAADHLRWREFLEYALWFQRYPQLLRAAGSEADAAGLLAQLFRGLTIDGALAAADAIATTPEPLRRRLRVALASQQPRTPEETAVRASLQRSLARPITASGSFSPAGPSIIERYFFYDDADGVESFESFRTQYARLPKWRWEERDGWVRVTGKAGPRSVEIVANRPVDALSASNRVSPAERARRQRAVSDYLGDREPSVIVHRGHAYHVEKTLEHLSRATRLVFLGSCRGLTSIRAVIDASPQADIITTRAVGTRRVNDPLLAALNEAMLRGQSLDWSRFWAGVSPRFARDRDFTGYLPPHRNGAAVFMRLFDSLR